MALQSHSSSKSISDSLLDVFFCWWFQSNGTSYVVVAHYFLTACTHLPDNPICYSQYTMLPIHLCALTRVCKQQIPLLFKHMYDSSYTWVCIKMGGNLIAPDRLASTWNSLMLPNLTPTRSSRHHHHHWPRNQGSSGCSEALLCSGELQHSNP